MTTSDGSGTKLDAKLPSALLPADPLGRWITVERPGRGRCVVAGPRGFAAGETVMRCQPLAAVLSFERFGSRCFRCFQSCDKVKRCAKCHVMGYCGRPCQAADWAFHKRECRHVNRSIEAFSESFVGGAVAASSQEQADGSLADMLLVARTLWLLHARPNPEFEALCLAPGDFGVGPRSLAAFMVGHPAAAALLPPGATLARVVGVLSRFRVNNFGVVDDLQARL